MSVAWRCGALTGGFPALAVEERRQTRGRDGPVGVLAQLGDLGPVRVAVEPDADPSPAAYVGRPEVPRWLGRDELVLCSGQARAPQVGEVVGMVAAGPERGEALAPDEPGGRAMAEPLGDLR